jgi:hypothetical protein
MRLVLSTFAFNRRRTLASMVDFKVALDEFAFQQFGAFLPFPFRHSLVEPAVLEESKQRT